jgi:hypothetical protein
MKTLIGNPPRRVASTAVHWTRLLQQFNPIAIILCCSLYVFSYTVADPDLWGHIKFGQDIVQTGVISRSDSYSYRTEGQRWINHEWLAEATFAKTYDLAGPVGLVAGKVLIACAMLLMLYKHLIRKEECAWHVMTLLTAAGVALWMGLGTLRPQVFSYGLFLVMSLLISWARAGHEYWLWPAPLVCALWANLHGGVLAGVGILILWSATRVVSVIRSYDQSTSQRILMQTLLIMGTSLVALTCNPYGVELALFLLRTGVVARPEVLEWRPLALGTMAGVIYVGLLIVGIMGFCRSGQEKEPVAMLIFSTTAILPLLAQRHYPLFALAFLVFAGPHVLSSWKWRRRQLSYSPYALPLVTVVNVLLCGLFIVGSIHRLSCIPIVPNHFAFPARAVAILKGSRVQGNLALPFDWGEFAIWHLSPRVKVSMDGRRETVYSDQTYKEALKFEQGVEGWDALLKDASAPTDMVLARLGSNTAKRMDGATGWVALYRDRFAMLYVRRDSRLIPELVNTPIRDIPDDGAGLCFPPPQAEKLRHAR